jgi:hypothetical protein
VKLLVVINKGPKGQQKLFNSKKLSFNQSGVKQNMVNVDQMNLLSRKLNTNKIYSRNDANMTMGPGCFLTTGDGIMDKRYSNRARQPKQTYYFNKKSRMNKTMVNALNKSTGSSKNDHMIQNASTNPPKRSSSGKTKKPKSGRGVSRNNKNVAIYTMAPVMTMTYKKKAKTFK